MEERPILELLKLMKRKMSVYFCSGLCNMLSNMLHYKEITFKEHQILRYLVKYNRPRDTWYYRNFVQDRGFYWRATDPKPRIKWINSIIEMYHLK